MGKGLGRSHGSGVDNALGPERGDWIKHDLFEKSARIHGMD